MPGGVEFEDQLQRPSTRQPKAMRFIRTDAVTHQLRWAVTQASAAISGGKTMNQIVLDAAPGHAPSDSAIITQSHHRTYRPGRGTPRPCHRSQQDALSSSEPLLRGAKNQQVDTFHRVS